MTLRPATVTFAVRLPPLLATTLTVTLPAPVLPAVTAAHEEPEDVVQEQPALVDTETTAEPAPAPNASDVGVTE